MSTWDIDKSPLQKAREALNEILGLTAISPWNYRKGVTYFLRTQADYLDVFQTSRFAMGKHIYWKPYVATVLGFPSNWWKKNTRSMTRSLRRKQFRKEYSKQVGVDPTEYDRIKGMIEIKREEVDAKPEKDRQFQFL